MKERKRKSRDGGELLRENTRNFELRYRRLLLQRMGKQRPELQQEYEAPSTKGTMPRSPVVRREASHSSMASDDDSSDEDDAEVRYVDDEVIVAVIALLKKLNQQRMALGLEPDDVFIPSPSSDAEMWAAAPNPSYSSSPTKRNLHVSLASAPFGDPPAAACACPGQ